MSSLHFVAASLRWLGSQRQRVAQDVRFRKGAEITDGCVIAPRSMVTKFIKETSALIDRSSAKLVGSEIRWAQQVQIRRAKPVGQGCRLRLAIAYVFGKSTRLSRSGVFF